MGKRLLAGAVLAFSLVFLVGCMGQASDWKLTELAYRGQFGDAREYLKPRIVKLDEKDSNRAQYSKDNPDRAYALDRMRLGLVTLADGYAEAGPGPWIDLYDILRTSGVNKGKEVMAVAINEDMKIWKGEPFEQAIAFHYIGLHFAMQGSWDNARSAYGNSLFQLHSLGREKGTTQEIVEASVDKPATQTTKAKLAELKLEDAKPHKTNFTLGYLMRAVASKQLQVATGDVNRGAEANTDFNEAVNLNPNLKGLVESLKDTKSYNTLLVVDYGQGPQKIGTGTDYAIAGFANHCASDQRTLQVTLNSGGTRDFGQVCDVNLMANNYMWNSLEDMRIAKSRIGSSLMIAGAAVAAAGANTGGNAGGYMALAGLGMMAAGALAKAGSHADTRYCELVPQRVYVAPVTVTAPNTQVTLQIGDLPSSRMVLFLDPPKGPTSNLRYVRLLSPVTKFDPEGKPVKEDPAPMAFALPAWATANTILYASDESPNTAKMALPYILGGYCVRSPSAEALADYQRAGFLKDMSVEQLKALYTAEGIKLTVAEEQGIPGKHVLEGGHNMACPKKGTVGFTRLFCAEHPAYAPQSQQVKDLKAKIDAQLHPNVAHPAVAAGKP